MSAINEDLKFRIILATGLKFKSQPIGLVMSLPIGERDTLIERISSRINESTKQHFHFYGDKITKEEAILLLKSFTI